ncbi:MAG: endonuclease III domain-containing protein [Gammaproteobacteria bacterium]
MPAAIDQAPQSPADLQARAVWIAGRLDAFEPCPPIPLEHKDPYTLLIAVLLSAQCTDVRVNQVTPELFALADAPEQMMHVPQHQILDVVRPCGLGPQKSKAIQKLSAILTECYDGRVPADIEALETLPGVGHKTASVVMVQAFNQAAFPVDTHIHRLAARWGLSSGRSVVQTERDLKALFPQKDWGKLHLQMIYYGRAHCSASRCRKPSQYCEICSYCRSDVNIG